MRTLESIRNELCEITAAAIDNLAIQNKPEFMAMQRHNSDWIGRAATEVTFNREGPIEVVTIPFYGKEVKLKFKFGHPRELVPQDVLDKFKASRDDNVVKIAIMFDHVINEVFKDQS